MILPNTYMSKLRQGCPVVPSGIVNASKGPTNIHMYYGIGSHDQHIHHVYNDPWVTQRSTPAHTGVPRVTIVP